MGNERGHLPDTFLTSQSAEQWRVARITDRAIGGGGGKGEVGSCKDDPGKIGKRPF